VLAVYWSRYGLIRRAHYILKNVSIVGGPNPEFQSRVEIRCDGKIIPRVTKTTLSFWNSGNRTIRQQDLPKGDPLRISFPKGTEVIELEVLNMTTPANMAHVVDIKDDGAVPGFEFLDPKQGFAFEVLHTALADEVKVEGTIIGVGKPTMWDKNSAKDVIFYLALILSINMIFTVCIAGAAIWLMKMFNISGWIQSVIMLISIVLSVVAAMMFLQRVADYTEKRGIPNNLVS
jgi:hypothetical protein